MTDKSLELMQTELSLELMQTELSIQFMDGLIEFKEIKDFFTPISFYLCIYFIFIFFLELFGYALP